jgi:YVTN family beta-propeller protein
MSTGTKTARRAVLRWLVMPAVLISLAAGLGSVVPVPQAAADAARMTGSPGSPTVPAASATTNTATIGVGANPIGVGVDPSAHTVYVANTENDTVSVINEATNTVTATIGAVVYPDGVGVDPATHTVYVANAAAGSSTVSVINEATNTVTATINVGAGSEPENVGVDPSTHTVYVTSAGSNTVSVINGATNTVTATINVANFPVGVGVDPSTHTVYVTNTGSNTVSVFTPAIITGAPAFTSGSAATAHSGVAFTFTVTATGDPAPTITKTGVLPSGVKFTDDGDGTATISGTPRKAVAGVYPLTLTARNTNGTATQAFTLTVTWVPAIRRIRTARARVGVALRLTIRATGYPAPALAESGPLPGGLSFTDNGNGTAAIRGTPAPDSDGRYPITITATNASGTATGHVTIIVTQRRRR